MTARNCWKALTTACLAVSVAADFASHAYADPVFEAVPEINAGSAAGALTLLIGGGMLLKDQILARLGRK